MRVGCSFSSGKDSMLAMKKMLDAGHECVILMTTGSSKDKSWFHDVDTTLLTEISKSLRIPLEVVMCGIDREYAEDFELTLRRYVEELKIEGFIFGDIDLEAHREWCTKRTNNCGIEAFFPLWKQPRESVVREFIDCGFKASIKKVKKGLMDSAYLGKTLTHELIDELIEQQIDACGENGEYHTVVLDGPLFHDPIKVRFGEISESDTAYSIGLKQPLHQLAILGCASNVGKTTIVAGLCRYLANKQKSVVPFKAMNLSRISGISTEGLKMGKGQVLQARASRLAPSIDMNPLLFQPSENGMKVYVNGLLDQGNHHIFEDCYEAYLRLANKADYIILEGSGSCAELNSKGCDYANFPIVSKVDAPVILVADIERCGVFASVYGTLMLLSEDERKRVKGILINKFHGDVSHFDEGKRLLEERCQVRILGVIGMHDLTFEEEDMESKRTKLNPLRSEEDSLDLLAKHLERFCDMEAITEILEDSIQ